MMYLLHGLTFMGLIALFMSYLWEEDPEETEYWERKVAQWELQRKFEEEHKDETEDRNN